MQIETTQTATITNIKIKAENFDKLQKRLRYALRILNQEFSLDWEDEAELRRTIADPLEDLPKI